MEWLILGNPPRPLDSGLPPLEYPSPSRDMLRPLQPPQHRNRNPPAERADKASPLPTPRLLPHPTGNEHKSRGDFSQPHTPLRGGRGPGYKGNPATYLRRPEPVGGGDSSRTLRSTDPRKQNLPSAVYARATRRETPPTFGHNGNHTLGSLLLTPSANIAMDIILALLQATYTVPQPTARDTQALTDLVSVAIPVRTFIL